MIEGGRMGGLAGCYLLVGWLVGWLGTDDDT